ncbi:hypothetical protein [Nostoc sp. UHCC 0252]|uniref:hypothetical protein n=1 Tax=Nostoc sp. UHCC 0252 TaxID=3110241 RepID=UPI002B203477|nr:hypothetical protein [Nostoc sp. UHCC 0252]MEA5603973.1 hypothetical protein [Nostoc sp. UHCC 0252]
MENRFQEWHYSPILDYFAGLLMMPFVPTISPGKVCTSTLCPACGDRTCDDAVDVGDVYDGLFGDRTLKNCVKSVMSGDKKRSSLRKSNK